MKHTRQFGITAESSRGHSLKLPRTARTGRQFAKLSSKELQGSATSATVKEQPKPRGLEALRLGLELQDSRIKLNPGNKFIKEVANLDKECSIIRHISSTCPDILSKTGAAGSLGMFAAAIWDELGLEQAKAWSVIEAH